jgi:hypothetical protein
VKRLFSGGCHCGAVRFEAMIDVALGSIKCNCTICAKNRLWMYEVAPDDMRVVKGAGELTDYGFNDHVAHHHFCRHCGVHPFEYVELPLQGRRYYNVNVVCLDGLDLNEVMAAPIVCVDGLHDRWDRVPAETRHL